MHGDVLARWFVFTDRETWWHDEGLDVELRRSEAILAPATADDDVLLVGGGGLLPFDRFLILSRAAVSKLADGAFLGACRERLRACDPNERRAGCKFKGQATNNASYTAAQLAHYCLAADLAKCRRPGGCAWLFGAPSEAGRDAKAARRRFVANDGRKPARKVAGAAPDDAPCAVHDALRRVVAIGHADDFEALSALRDRGRRCATDAGRDFACQRRVVEPPRWRWDWAYKRAGTAKGGKGGKRKAAAAKAAAGVDGDDDGELRS